MTKISKEDRRKRREISMQKEFSATGEEEKTRIQPEEVIEKETLVDLIIEEDPLEQEALDMGLAVEEDNLDENIPLSDEE